MNWRHAATPQAPAVTRYVYDGIPPVEEFVWDGGSEAWLLARELAPR